LPPKAAGFFLVDRVILDVIESSAGSRANIFLLLAELNFPQTKVTYEKQARRSGRSGWTLRKKIALGVTTVMAVIGAHRKASPVQCSIEKATDDDAGNA